MVFSVRLIHLPDLVKKPLLASAFPYQAFPDLLQILSWDVDPLPVDELPHGGKPLLPVGADDHDFSLKPSPEKLIGYPEPLELLSRSQVHIKEGGFRVRAQDGFDRILLRPGIQGLQTPYLFLESPLECVEEVLSIVDRHDV